MKNNIYIILAALVLTACTDTLVDQFTGGWGMQDADSDIGFTMNVEEMSQRLYNIGQTRAAAGDSAFVVECPPQNRLLRGIGENVYVNRLEMPVVGGQARAYSAPNAATRAKASDIVTSLANNFPDSITIFGYAFDYDDNINTPLTADPSQAQLQRAYETQRNLFNVGGNLLKRIRDWRSSVHWPYDRQFMQFGSIAPSIEQTDVSVVRAPGFVNNGGTYSAAPSVYRFKVPDDINRQHDLLYGTSNIIQVQRGPLQNGDKRDPNLGLDNKSITINYHHILTSIRFARGTLPKDFIVTNIRLENIVNEGNFHANVSTPPGTWNTEENQSLEHTDAVRAGHYDIPTYYKSPSYEDASGQYIDKDQVLFLMPHACSSDAKLIVTILVPDASGMTLIEDAEGSTVSDAGTYNVLKYNSTSGYLEGATFSSETKYKRYSEHTPSVALTGDVWPVGYTVTYNLSVEKLRAGYTLSIASEPVPIEHDLDNSGVNGVFMVDSYAGKKDYSKDSGLETGRDETSSPLAFSVLGYSSTEDGTPELSKNPTWLTINSITLTGGVGTESRYTVNFHFQNQQYDTTFPHGNHYDKLRSNRRRDNVNLAAQDPNGNYFTSNSSLLETANSYIINRPGTYRFPMVYGNAKYIIPGGTPTQGTKTDFSGFYDHNGDVITNAWIRQHLPHDAMPSSSSLSEGVTSAAANDYQYEAELVWQDAESLVSNVGVYVQDNNYIYFEVEQANIRPGNAVIALKGRPVQKTVTLNSRESSSAYIPSTTTVSTNTDGDDIVTVKNITYSDVYGNYVTDNVTERIHPTAAYSVVWTWHIWVTDEIYPNQLGDANTSIAIGSDKIMPVNLGWVPDVMECGSYRRREAWVTFKQNSGNNTFKVHFMQHARPDIITGHTTLYQWGRPTALPMLVSNATDAATAVTLYDKNGDAIGSPTFSSATGISGAIQNPLQMLASWTPASNYWNGTEKTIYDPCPAGFRMPAATLFSVVGLTGSPVTGGSNLNMWADASNANSVVVKNGEEKKGGWFYSISRTSFDASALTDRYGINASTSEVYTYVPNPAMFYLPATGWWPAGSAGSAMKAAIAERDAARYWTGDNDTYLFVLPKKTEPGTVADWTSTYNTYSTSMSVRPMGEVLGN